MNHDYKYSRNNERLLDYITISQVEFRNLVMILAYSLKKFIAFQSVENDYAKTYNCQKFLGK